MNPFMQRKLSDLFITLHLQDFILFCRQLQKFVATEGKSQHPFHLTSKVQDRYLKTGKCLHSEMKEGQVFLCSLLLLLTEFL